MSIGQRVSFNHEVERVRTTIHKDVTRAIGSGASMPRKPSALRRARRHEKVTELLLAMSPSLCRPDAQSLGSCVRCLFIVV